jgi:hypothetical protein
MGWSSLQGVHGKSITYCSKVIQAISDGEMIIVSAFFVLVLLSILMLEATRSLRALRQSMWISQISIEQHSEMEEEPARRPEDPGRDVRERLNHQYSRSRSAVRVAGMVCGSAIILVFAWCMRSGKVTPRSRIAVGAGFVVWMIVLAGWALGPVP